MGIARGANPVARLLRRRSRVQRAASRGRRRRSRQTRLGDVGPFSGERAAPAAVGRAPARAISRQWLRVVRHLPRLGSTHGGEGCAAAAHARRCDEQHVHNDLRARRCRRARARSPAACGFDAGRPHDQAQAIKHARRRFATTKSGWIARPSTARAKGRAASLARPSARFGGAASRLPARLGARRAAANVAETRSPADRPRGRRAPRPSTSSPTPRRLRRARRRRLAWIPGQGPLLDEDAFGSASRGRRPSRRRLARACDAAKRP